MNESKQWEQDGRGGMSVTEATGEYTLPDYLPEVKRILRVDCQVLSCQSYATENEVEAGGALRYSVLYTDKEGALASASLDGTYVGRVPTQTGAKATVIPALESASCRPLGPRHLAMKANIRLHPFATVTRTADTPIPEGCGEVETLRKVFPTSHTCYLHTGDVPLTMEFRVESGSRVMSADARFLPREVGCEEGGMSVKGEVWISCLLTNAQGIPYTVKGKIPVEESLSDPDVGEGAQGVVTGTVREMSVTVSEGEGDASLLVDAFLDLWGVTGENTEVSVITDLYGMSYSMTAGTAPMTSRQYVGMYTGNFTVDGSHDTAGMECRPDSRVLDARGVATVQDVRRTGEEIAVDGEVKVSCITHGEEGYAPANFVLPFRVRFAERNPLPEDTVWQALPECISCHARMDGDRIACECELMFTLIASRQETGHLLSDVTVDADHPLTRECGVVKAVYLTDGDSLWSIAKRYRVSVEEIARGNSLPDEILAHPDAPYLLDGIARLVI